MNRRVALALLALLALALVLAPAGCRGPRIHCGVSWGVGR